MRLLEFCFKCKDGAWFSGSPLVFPLTWSGSGDAVGLAQLLRGWRELNAAVPEPEVAAGLWLWERCRQAQPGSHTVPVPFK